MGDKLSAAVEDFVFFNRIKNQYKMLADEILMPSKVRVNNRFLEQQARAHAKHKAEIALELRRQERWILKMAELEDQLGPIVPDGAQAQHFLRALRNR